MSKDIELMLDVGQANELKLAFRRTGWTNADVKKLCDGDMLETILRVVRDPDKVMFGEHLVDLDADPFIPKGWKVESHRKGGQLIWSPEKVKLYFSEAQKSVSSIEAQRLLWDPENKRMMNANLLDYLLKNPNLIPKKWKNEEVFFWGTIYRDSDGKLCVRYLECGRRWRCRGFYTTLGYGLAAVAS